MNEHETNGFIPNNDAATETSTTPVVTCPECQREFKNAQALRMHHIRKHSGKGWNTADNLRKQGTKWSLARRRRFNKSVKLRAEAKTTANAAMAKRNVEWKSPTPAPVAVTFCPRCGCNIKVVAAAIAFGDKS